MATPQRPTRPRRRKYTEAPMRRQNPGRSVRDIAARARTTRAYPVSRSISSACPPPTIPEPHAQRHTLPGQFSPQSTPRPTPERGVRAKAVGPGSGRSLPRPTVQVPSGLRGQLLLPGSHQPEAPVGIGTTPWRLGSLSPRHGEPSFQPRPHVTRRGPGRKRRRSGYPPSHTPSRPHPRR